MSRDPKIVSKTMSAIRGKDTGIELKLRKALFDDGFRFLCCSSKAFGHPDILFLRERVAVFLDSEFWHGYRFEENEARIKSHRDYWIPKIKRNMARDEEVNAELAKRGYKVMRYWGFEVNKDLERVKTEVEEAVKLRRSALDRCRRITELTTLSYYRKDGKYLLLYRDKKEHDLNQGKYIGIGGHVEAGETYIEASKREFFEETGLVVGKQRYIAKIDFVNENCVERMYLFRVDSVEGELSADCDEGELRFVESSRMGELPMWEGDRIFLPLLDEESPSPYSMTLIYRGSELLDCIGPYKELKVNSKKTRKAKKFKKST